MLLFSGVDGKYKYKIHKNDKLSRNEYAKNQKITVFRDKKSIIMDVFRKFGTIILGLFF